MFSGSVKVTDKHKELFERAGVLLSKMDSQPTLVSVTAAFLNQSDRVKELEEEITKLKRVH